MILSYGTCSLLLLKCVSQFVCKERLSGGTKFFVCSSGGNDDEDVRVANMDPIKVLEFSRALRP